MSGEGWIKHGCWQGMPPNSPGDVIDIIPFFIVMQDFSDEEEEEAAGPGAAVDAGTAATHSGERSGYLWNQCF